MIPLQYVNAEELVQLFRVADPFGFKGSGYDANSVGAKVARLQRQL